MYVLGWGLRDVDRRQRTLTDRDLLHIERRTGEEHRPALGDRDHRDRIRLTERSETRALQRIDSDVDFRALTAPDLLAVVEHGCVILLTLADHDDTAHAHRVEHDPHRID